MSQVISLPNFGFLAVTGKDAITFMQGYTTCDLEDLDDKTPAMGAVCNLQGRMVTSFRCVRLPDGVLFRMNRELVAETMTFLQKYIVFSKAEMTDRSDDLKCFGIIGDDVPVSAAEDSHRIPVAEGGRFEVWGPSGMFPDAEQDSSEWWKREVEDGLAWVSEATKEEFIPQMFDYHSAGAIDFDKGCYLGQEIVARMQYRGNLNRKLQRGRAGSSTGIGQPLLDDSGKRVGTIVAAAGNDFLAVVQAKGETTPDCTLESGEPVEICPVQSVAVK